MSWRLDDLPSHQVEPTRHDRSQPLVFGYYWQLFWDADPQQLVGEGFARGALPDLKHHPGYHYRITALTECAVSLSRNPLHADAGATPVPG